MIRALICLCVFWTHSTEIFGENNGPQLVHISLGSPDTSMIIVWSTANNSSCDVLYDKDRNFRFRVPGNVSRLLPDNWNALTYLYRAQLHNLEKNQTYYYHVVCKWNNTILNSEVYKFRTLSDDREQTVNLIVYGDMGSEAGKRTMPSLEEEMETGKYQAIFHNGDFGYNLESEGGAVGDKFFKMIQPIAAQFPYMTSPGNHELANDLMHYRYRFSMPGATWPMPLDKLWYSFDIGPVHFISYSTEVYFIHNQDYTCVQYDWLLEDLIKANRNRDKTPWIVAMGHRPMYCSNNNMDDCTPHVWGQWVKRGLEELFYGMGVDLIIEAHEHSYERLWPVHYSKVIQENYINPRGPIHVISGAGGSNEGVDWMGKTHSWSAFRADDRSRNSYGRLSVINKTHLYFDQVSAITKGVIDKFWIVQEHHGPLISNINCSNKHSKNKACTCPPPFHFVTALVMFSLAVVMVSLASVLLCCFSCNCCTRFHSWCCRPSCRTTSLRSKRSVFFRRQFEHIPLVNSDLEDDFHSYQIENIELGIYDPKLPR